MLRYLDCGGEVYATYSLGVTTDDQDNQSMINRTCSVSDDA
jgi:hypothetical protein